MKNLTKNQIETLPWERLARVWATTKSKKLKQAIGKEARKFGYRMQGFIVANTLNKLER